MPTAPLTEDGQLNRLLAGKHLARVEKDGHFLTLVCSDGHAVRIAWRSDDGATMQGEPYLAHIDVRIALPVSARLHALAGARR